MTRLTIMFVFAAALSGCVTTSPLTQATIVQMALTGSSPARPLSAPQNPAQCIHDEGYSRWTDCGSEM